MAKEVELFRTTLIDPSGATFYRQLLFTTFEGETVQRCIFWAEHWAVNETGWSEESPNNSCLMSITFTQGPDTGPPPTPPQPTNNPMFPGILWWGVLPLRFTNWSTTGTASTNNQWMQTPPEGIETRGSRITATGNQGGIWYQLAQFRHNAVDPFNQWCSRISIFAAILSPPGGFTAARRQQLRDQAEADAAAAGAPPDPEMP